jgi:kynurenine formamidase
MSGSEVVELLSTLSNWGRWGDDDQLGTLNFIGDNERIAAAALVRDGHTVGCGRPISPQRGTATEPLIHLMMGAGAEMPEQGMGASGDWFSMFIHGYTVTHIDSHAHVGWNRKIYNGRDAAEHITASGGAKIGGVEPIVNGVLGRGVLLDVAQSSDQPLEPGAAVHVDDVKRCLDQQQVSIQPGDMLLVRFGGGEPPLSSVPASHAMEGSGPRLTGLAADCLPWLHSEQVSVLGSDAISDVSPPAYAEVPMPIHTVGIVAMGLWIIDNLDLELLAQNCAARERWTFLFVFAPLHLTRATGCPINPIAVF